MKVTIVTDFPDRPDSPVGGVQAISVQLVHTLAQYVEHEISVVTLSENVQSSDWSDWHGAKIIRLPRHEGNSLKVALGSGAKMIESAIEEIAPDIVHSHDTYGLMVRNVDRPRIFTIHGFIHADIVVSESKFRKIRSLIWKYYETKGWTGHDAIISISPYVREVVREYFSGPIYNIDNPIAHEFFDISTSECEMRVFSAAAICRRKNTRGLVEAISILAGEGLDVTLSLAGPITEQRYYLDLCEFIEDRNLQNKVRFLGQIDISGICDQLSRSAVFALVSREENSPVGIEEAMAVGVPVVTSNRCGMPYMVEHGYSGLLVDPESPRIIAAAIKKLVTCTAQEYEVFQKRNIEIATSRFHPDVVAAKTYCAYQEVIEGGATFRFDHLQL